MFTKVETSNEKRKCIISERAEQYPQLQTKDFFCDDTVPASVEINYMRDQHVWHYFLKDGFPHRVKEESSGVYKYSYNRKKLYAGYRKSVNLLIEKDCIEVYQEKVWLYIKCHYPAGKRKVDFDNLDVKLFIDTCVKIPFLQDDSPDYLSVIYDSDDKGDGVDVYLGLKEDIFRIVSNYAVCSPHARG